MIVLIILNIVKIKKRKNFFKRESRQLIKIRRMHCAAQGISAQNLSTTREHWTSSQVK
jgi:hypothetical protein